MNIPKKPRSNNYFKVGDAALAIQLPPAPPPEEGSIPDDASDKVRRIMSKPPTPIDFGRFFFFDDGEPASILKAFEGARKFSNASGIVAFRTPALPGPWSDVPVVGQGVGDLQMEPN